MPFTTIEFAGWRIEVDVERTRAAYALVQQGRCDRCGCLYCLNFVEARTAVYPGAFLAVLELLGVAFEKECEACEYGPMEDGFAMYNGWFHFFGIAVKDSQSTVVVAEPSNGFTCQFHTDYRPHHTELTGARCVLDFHCRVPWLLEDQPPVSYKPKG